MSSSTLLVTLILLMAVGFYYGRQRSLLLAKPVGGAKRLHSLPKYYGYMTALWCGIPALLLLGFWTFFQPFIVDRMIVQALPDVFAAMPESEVGLAVNDIKNLVENKAAGAELTTEQLQQVSAYENLNTTASLAKAVLVLILAIGGALLALKKVDIDLRARVLVEKVIYFFLISCSSVAILTTVGIVFSVLFEAMRFFGEVPMTDFLFGTTWSPQTAIRSDQVGSSGSFGAIPLFAGTMLISAIAMIVAVPLGLLSAIYLSEYATPRMRAITKPLLEVLAGIPTVVYGFFAALTVAPAIRGLGESIGLSVSSESALAAGIVMGIMIIPFVSSLSDDVINAVPQAMRDGSYGLGATQSETIRKVILPAALPGIVGGVLLAVSRAIGETMIVVMAAGLAANLTANPLEAVTTVTVQIVTLLTGDQEFDSAKTLAAFALGLMLFVTTLILNVIALHVVRKYREQYE